MEKYSKELIIRKAQREELKNIVDIFKNAIFVMNENNIPQWDELYPNEEILKEDIEKEQMYLAVTEKDIAAVFVINREYDDGYIDGSWKYSDKTFVVLHRFCVNPQFQNKGYGGRTLRRMESMLKDMGVESIRLDAFPLNPYAIRMYEKQEYVKVGETNFRKGLFYLYEKKI